MGTISRFNVFFYNFNTALLAYQAVSAGGQVGGPVLPHSRSVFTIYILIFLKGYQYERVKTSTSTSIFVETKKINILKTTLIYFHNLIKKQYKKIDSLVFARYLVGLELMTYTIMNRMQFYFRSCSIQSSLNLIKKLESACCIP